MRFDRFCRDEVPTLCVARTFYLRRQLAEEEDVEGGQCVQMARLFFNIWPFASMKTCSMAQKFPKVGPNFPQIGNKPSENCPRL